LFEWCPSVGLHGSLVVHLRVDCRRWLLRVRCLFVGCAARSVSVSFEFWCERAVDVLRSAFIARSSCKATWTEDAHDVSFSIDCSLTLEFSQSKQLPKLLAFIASSSLWPARVTQRSSSALRKANGSRFQDVYGGSFQAHCAYLDYLVEYFVGCIARRA
jgi:hypothetical protein